MTLSLLLGDGTVQIKLANGQEVQGEFIGTYMDHVHVLTGEKLYYYACDEIRSIGIKGMGSLLHPTSAPGETFDYDCSENTVTADILFPPVLDPMTGEWAQKLPDVFNPDIAKPIVKKVADAVDTDPPTVDLGEVDPRFDEEVSTFEKKDVTEEDFIMINGVKYVRAAPDGQTDQDNLPRTTKKKKRKKKREAQLSDREIRSMALEDAKLNHNDFTWTATGFGSCGLGWVGAVMGIEMTESFFGFLAGGGLGLSLPYLVASSYDPSYLPYPREIKTLSGKKLYEKTYASKTRRLRIESLKDGPKYTFICATAFIGLLILGA
jgi:hypothetical protein